jgi:sulfur relay (sulfurtransferase) complex TusBCD TusD component (DsrE family)
MSHYLFIQSQDPFIEARTAAQYDLATQLAQAGHQVRMLLVQNGVSAARQGARCATFDNLMTGPVVLLAETLSLQQREIAPEQLKNGVQPGELALVVDALLAGEKVIWN